MIVLFGSSGPLTDAEQRALRQSQKDEKIDNKRAASQCDAAIIRRLKTGQTVESEED